MGRCDPPAYCASLLVSPRIVRILRGEDTLSWIVKGGNGQSSRRPRASPLYRPIENQLEEFATVYDERFARRRGYSRPVVARGVEKYFACGVLKHGFARVRCGSCKYEFLLAFCCKCRYSCPNCHAKRLALWDL